MWFIEQSNAVLVFVPAVGNGAIGSLLLITSLSMTNTLIGLRSVSLFDNAISVGSCITDTTSVLPTLLDYCLPSISGRFCPDLCVEVNG